MMTLTVRSDAAQVLRGAMLIDGALVERGSGGTYEHRNAATGQIQQTVPLAGPEEVDRAVVSARRAFPAWRGLTPDRRRDVLFRLADLLRGNAAELSTMTTLENGTPSIVAGTFSSSYPADWFAYFAGWPERIGGETVPVVGATGLDYTLAEPYGVIAAIIPWNGPMASIGMKVAPALAAGNCVVIKPPELAPFTAVRFGELCLEAGLPPGVVNVVVGGAETGDALVRHPGVDKISFTGGIDTARKVMVSAAENVTPLLLELGGKSANLIFDDADLGTAVSMAVMMGIAALSGQGCVLPTRLLLHDSIYDAALEQVTEMARCLPVGDPFEPTTLMGPVVSAAHCARIERVIDRAKADASGRLVAGGGRLGGSLAEGYFLEPTVFADVDNGSHLAQEEIFGPVLSVLRFRTEDEAIAIANGTKYGLGGYVWTSDVKRSHRLAARLDAGWVNVNAVPLIAPSMPFGGVRNSGFGREGGKAGLGEFLRTKNVFINLD